MALVGIGLLIIEASR